jgi:hypothetical protein
MILPIGQALTDKGIGWKYGFVNNGPKTNEVEKLWKDVFLEKGLTFNYVKTVTDAAFMAHSGIDISAIVIIKDWMPES